MWCECNCYQFCRKMDNGLLEIDFVYLTSDSLTTDVSLLPCCYKCCLFTISRFMYSNTFSNYLSFWWPDSTNCICSRSSTSYSSYSSYSKRQGQYKRQAQIWTDMDETNKNVCTAPATQAFNLTYNPLDLFKNTCFCAPLFS